MIGSSFRDNLFEMTAAQMLEGSDICDSGEEDLTGESDQELRFDYTHDLGVPSCGSGMPEARDIGAVKGVSAAKPSREGIEWSLPYSVTDRVDLSAGAFQLLLCA